MKTASILALGAALVAPLISFLSSRPKAAEAPADVIAAMVEQRRTPGAQYLHVNRDRVMISYEAGLADVRQNTPVTESTVFAGFSTTKTLTATAVLRLAARGQIDLDAPVSRYLPELGGKPMPTVRQTLQHTGGWANPVPVGWVHPMRDHETFDRSGFVRRVLTRHGKPGAAGRKFAYSNVGYLVLGEIVRRVTNQEYEAFVTADVISPLRLTDGAALGFAGATRGPAAVGYVRRHSMLDFAIGWFLDRRANLETASRDWVAFKPLVVDGSAYGGIYGNARGFSEYLQAMLRETPPFDNGIVAMLSESGSLADGQLTPAGHGWFRGSLNGEPYLHHAGGGGGFYCEIRLYPRLGRASVVMFNRSAMSDEKLLDRIDATLVGTPDKKADR